MVSKKRPALLLKSVPNSYEDWLVCMISSKTGQEIIGLDEIISPLDSDFSETGLKSESVVRVSRLAVVSQKIFFGYIGQISPERLTKIQTNLANWILNN
ncbi:type II toxin-antitoxin system PemK/MazF family toxin [Cyanobacterium aponinum AL20118]|uniref:Type II toxin-antitoxin system PemK/MazF family toxin n=1 Tax=Cyanobacterium aponinum AL20115 TaxID=3090662 RepID=A0AAF1C358_9CHRO|nr:type II toxin-antitoxin system PemK/MazF family toxin [Cyanobacterium aponinum]WPF90442.1 type II toxin-antitoxin system PemK/MazF family toxin [Cyanobacterium aponinum AL20115]